MGAYVIRKARRKDLGFIVKVDRDGEGMPEITPDKPLTPEEQRAHRLKMYQFVRPALNTGPTEWDTCYKTAYLALEKGTGHTIGLVMFEYRNMNSPRFVPHGIFDKFDRAVFPPDGRFCEIYGLWVDPAWRRRGIATALKQHAETMARKNHLTMMYTHTSADNPHVVELNQKLGYRVIRTGPLWDEYVRVSLVKQLNV